MDLPSSGAPRMMITFSAEPFNVTADVAVGSVVLIVPQQKTGHASFVCLVSGRGKAVVRQAQKRGQLLDPNAAVIKQAFRARRDFANNRRWVTGLRRVIDRCRRQFQVPVEKILTPAVSRFRYALICQHQPTGK